MFRSFILFASLLVMHELGHFLTGHFLGWNLDKIYFYPYGGVSKFNHKMNVPLWEEFLVLVMGPLSQVFFYSLLSYILVRDQDLLLLKNYHYGILFFNLMPIYPLDGGKLFSLFLAKVFPYKKSLIYTFRISVVVFVIFFLFTLFPLNMSLCMMSFLLLSKLIEEMKRGPFYYHKFLMERYLEDFSFKKRKIIRDKEEMFRDYKHLFKKGNRYWTEREYLRRQYDNYN